MANRLTQFGNDLYTGKRSFNFVGGRKKWYLIAGIIIILTVAIPLIRGVNFSIEFRGGSQFQIAGVENATTQPASDAVASVVPGAVSHVTIVGGTGVRVQTEQLEQSEFAYLPKPEDCREGMEPPVKPGPDGTYPVFVPGETRLLL